MKKESGVYKYFSQPLKAVISAAESRVKSLKFQYIKH